MTSTLVLRQLPRQAPSVVGVGVVTIGFCDWVEKEVKDFAGSSHTSDLKIDTPVAALPGAWRYRISAGTGRPGVSILQLGEVESLICNFCLGVKARTIV